MRMQECAHESMHAHARAHAHTYVRKHTHTPVCMCCVALVHCIVSLPIGCICNSAPMRSGCLLLRSDAALEQSVLCMLNTCCMTQPTLSQSKARSQRSGSPSRTPQSMRFRLIVGQWAFFACLFPLTPPGVNLCLPAPTCLRGLALMCRCLIFLVSCSQLQCENTEPTSRHVRLLMLCFY